MKLLGIIAISFFLIACGEKSSMPSVSRSEHSALKSLALQGIRSGKTTLSNGPNSVCDKLEDEKFIETYGTVQHKSRTLPAILMRHQYICVEGRYASRERVEQWSFVAYDKEFDYYRCQSISLPYRVIGQMDYCQWQPLNGDIYPKIQELAGDLAKRDYQGAIDKLTAEKAPPSRKITDSTLPTQPGYVSALAYTAGPVPQTVAASSSVELRAADPAAEAITAKVAEPAKVQVSDVVPSPAHLEAVNPSFNCLKAQSVYEKLICGDRDPPASQ